MDWLLEEENLRRRKMFIWSSETKCCIWPAPSEPPSVDSGGVDEERGHVPWIFVSVQSLVVK